MDRSPQGDLALETDSSLEFWEACAQHGLKPPPTTDHHRIPGLAMRGPGQQGRWWRARGLWVRLQGLCSRVGAGARAWAFPGAPQAGEAPLRRHPQVTTRAAGWPGCRQTDPPPQSRFLPTRPPEAH